MKNDRSVLILGILLVLTYAFTKIFIPENQKDNQKDNIAITKKNSPIVVSKGVKRQYADSLKTIP